LREAGQRLQRCACRAKSVQKLAERYRPDILTTDQADTIKTLLG
jgi:hypothetical protein